MLLGDGLIISRAYDRIIPWIWDAVLAICAVPVVKDQVHGVTLAALVSVWSKSPSAGLCAVPLWLGELPAFLFGTLQVPNSNMSLPNPLLRQTGCVKLMRTFRHEKCTGEKILRPEPVAFPA